MQNNYFEFVISLSAVEVSSCCSYLCQKSEPNNRIINNNHCFIRRELLFASQGTGLNMYKQQYTCDGRIARQQKSQSFIR